MVASELAAFRGEENVMSRLQWDFFECLPVVLQDAATRDVLMVQYTTEDGLRRTLEERSMWLWSRSREEFWMAGRQSRGLRPAGAARELHGRQPAGDRRRDGSSSLPPGHKSCISQPVPGAPGGE